jgi:glucose-6-phosphate isomerase
MMHSSRTVRSPDQRDLELLTLGETMDINAFDQPGVEAVKKVTLGTLGDTRYKDQALNQP